MDQRTQVTDRRLSDAEHVHIGIYDLDGVFRHKRVSADKAAKLADEGYAFCDVLYQWDTAEQTYGSAAFVDRPAALDLDSLRPYPFEPKALLCVADFEGPFGELSPRNQLKRQLARAADLGFALKAAFEFEFFLFDETADTLRAKSFRDLNAFAKGNRTYSLQSAALHGELIGELEAAMATLGVGLDAIHTEMGPGCFEAPLAVAEGIAAADNAALFKNFTKAFFLKRGLMAGFMSKWSNAVPGQSGHLHVSLVDKANGRPLFSDGRGGLSETARHFVGGLLTLMPEWLAMTSHTVNAYKRLVPGAWAPIYAAWGIQNRTAAVRAITGADKATRVEYRVPSADTNPFLSLTMCLAAGLNGIEQRIEPPAPRQDDCYATEPDAAARFPRTLLEAAERFAASTAARQTFGEAFVEHFALSRRMEDLACRRAVTEWEVRRYLEVV